MKICDLVKKFRGELGEDVEQWLERFQTAVAVISDADVSEEEQREQIAKLMPLFLEGAAYTTWKQLTVEERKDLQEIKGALRRVYGKTKSAAWQEVKGLRLLPGEPVDVLADEARRLLSIVVGKDAPHEELVSVAQLDALPAEVARQVRMQHGEDMELAKVVSCAESLLADYGSGDGNMRSLMVRMAVAAVAHRPRPVPGGMEAERGSGQVSAITGPRCHACHKAGHLRRDCSLVCFRCGEKGHFQRDCRAAVQGNGRAGAATRDPAAPAQQH